MTFPRRLYELRVPRPAFRRRLVTRPAAGAPINQALDVAVLTLAGVDLTATGTGTSSTAPDVATLTLAGVDLAASGTGAAAQSPDPAVLTLTGIDLTVAGSTVEVTLDVAVLSLTGVDLTATGAGTASPVLDPATLTLTGVTPTAAGTGAAVVALDVAVLSLLGVGLAAIGSGAVAQTIDPAVLFLIGVDLATSGGDVFPIVVTGPLTLARVDDLRTITRGDDERTLAPLDDDPSRDRTRLVFPGVSGNYLWVPHGANLNIPGDHEVVARITRVTATAMVIIGKDDAAPRSWTFQIAATQQLALAVRIAGVLAITASAVIPTLTLGATLWAKVTRSATTGTVSYFYAADQPSEPTSWTAAGTGTTPAGNQDVNTGIVDIGASFGVNAMFNGRIARAIVRNGIAGTTVLDVHANNATAPDDSVDGATFTATTGQPVTVRQTGANIIVQTAPFDAGPPAARTLEAIL